eukprot:727249-Hanusia_phi.AAC.3
MARKSPIAPGFPSCLSCLSLPELLLRYLTPPDLNACGDRVLISMEDKTLGEKKKDQKDGLSWIQKVFPCYPRTSSFRPVSSLRVP